MASLITRGKTYYIQCRVPYPGQWVYFFEAIDLTGYWRSTFA